jgi:TPR repeat protein
MSTRLNPLYLAIALSLPMFAQAGEAHPIDPALLERGNAGDVVAQRQIGQMLLHGEGVSQDTTEGMHWLNLAAAKGDSNAEVELGTYYAARGGSNGFNAAVGHFQRAANHGNLHAADELAQTLIEHALRAQTPKAEGDAQIAQALPYLKPSVGRRNPTSCFYAGYLHFIGRGLPHDSALAEKNMRCAADQGNALAAFWVAGAILADVPAPYTTDSPRIDEARKYLTIAAERGHQGAVQMLASLPVPAATVARAAPSPAAKRDPAPAVQIQTAARTQAAPVVAPTAPRVATPARVQVAAPVPAILPVATKVECIKPDNATPTEADRLRDELAAANKRIEQLQAQVASIHDGQEEHIEAEALNRQALAAIRRGDYASAIPKLRSAMSMGDIPATANLGLLTMQGAGVPANAAEGIDLLVRAGNAGNRTAVENLAKIFEHGLYTHRDVARAVFWYRKAQALGSVRALPALKRLGATG